MKVFISGGCKNGKLFICMLLMLFTLAACGLADAGSGSGENAHTYDREGLPITTPAQIDTIISIGPSNTEILVELGFGDKIIQTDISSADVPGISDGISNLDLFAPDLEWVIDLAPDIIFVIGMTNDDHLRMIGATGITVINIPSSSSIDAIKEDIRFIAGVLGADARGEEIIADMSNEIERIRAIGEQITDRRTVYFEVSPAPHMFSSGRGTFLHEMIELVGAVNIFAGQDGWISVTDEALLEASPDVILTSVDFLDDPVYEIINRPGWNTVTAVQNGDVFVIDTNASNRQSHNIIKALREIAQAIYPDEFR